MKTKTIIALLVLCLACGNISAQAVATLADDTIPIGDQTTLTIRNALNYPSSEALTSGAIIALSQNFDTATRTQTTVITSFEPGEHYIRLSPDDSLSLVVTDVDVDTASMEPRDIMPLERIPYSFWEIFRWILLALAVAIVAFAIWWLSTHRKTVQTILGMTEPPDTRTPEERALQNLEALRRKQLWQNGKSKEYHTELTDILRRFIEEAANINATELTSEETIDAINGQWPAVSVRLRTIFATADLVKFAKSEPASHEHDRSMSEATQFVSELWQYVKPTEEADNE